jgi:hypothetical protein
MLAFILSKLFPDLTQCWTVVRQLLCYSIFGESYLHLRNALGVNVSAYGPRSPRLFRIIMATSISFSLPTRVIIGISTGFVLEPSFDALHESGSVVLE